MDKRAARRAGQAVRKMLVAAKELMEIEKQYKRKQAKKEASNEPSKH